MSKMVLGGGIRGLLGAGAMMFGAGAWAIPLLATIGVMGSYLYDRILNIINNEPQQVPPEKTPIDAIFNMETAETGKIIKGTFQTPTPLQVDTLVVNKVTNNPTTNTGSFNIASDLLRGSGYENVLAGSWGYGGT